MKNQPSELKIVSPITDPLGCSQPWCSLAGIGLIEHQGFEAFVPGRTYPNARVILTQLTSDCNVKFPITPMKGDVAFVDTFDSVAQSAKCSDDEILAALQRHRDEIDSIILVEEKCKCGLQGIPPVFGDTCPDVCTDAISPLENLLATYQEEIFRIGRWDGQRILDCLHGVSSTKVGDVNRPSISGIECTPDQQVRMRIEHRIPQVYGPQKVKLNLFRATLHRILATDLLKDNDFPDMIASFGHHVEFEPSFIVLDKSRTSCALFPENCAADCGEGDFGEFCLQSRSQPGATGRQLVHETVRHLCLWHETLKGKPQVPRLQKYIEYVDELESSCILNPTEQCSLDTHRKLGLSWEATHSCASSPRAVEMLREETTKMGAIYKSPSITLNGIYVPLDSISEAEVAKVICEHAFQASEPSYPATTCRCVAEYPDEQGIAACWQLRAQRSRQVAGVVSAVVLLLALVAACVVRCRRGRFSNRRGSQTQDALDAMEAELTSLPESQDPSSTTFAFADSAPDGVREDLGKGTGRSASARLGGLIGKASSALKGKQPGEDQEPLESEGTAEGTEEEQENGEAEGKGTEIKSVTQV